MWFINYLGVPDFMSESSDKNSDEGDMYSSSQEDGPSEVVDVIPVDASEKSFSEDAAAGKSVNTGYKIVFDNIDKNVIPRHIEMRRSHAC